MNLSNETNHSRLLIIDDNLAIHDDFRKILARKSDSTSQFDQISAEIFGVTPASGSYFANTFQLDSAYQGREGLELVQKAVELNARYAVAFVDVQMPPGWDGVETTTKIWQVDPDIQIVICTAYSDCSWDEMLTTLGYSDRLVILKKPFDSIEVFQLANSLSRKWHLLQESKNKMAELEERVAERTAQLVQEQQRFKGIFENSPEGIYQISANGCVLTANPALAHIYGYPSPAELLEIKNQLYVDPQRRVDFTCLLEKDQVVREFESEIRCKDGTRKWISETACKVTGPDGSLLHYQGFVVDITARRQMEENLNQLFKQQQTILDAAPIGIAFLKDHRIQWTNGAFDGTHGYTAEDLIGADASIFYARPEDYEHVGREAPARFRQGQAYAEELEFKRKDGTRFWCLLRGRAINPADPAEGAIWMMMDVTLRRNTEEALRKSEENFRSVFANAPVGIFQSSPDRLGVANPALAKMFGYQSPEEMVGCAFLAESFFVQPADRRMLVRQAVESGLYTQGEVEFRRKDGSVFIGNMRLRAIRDEKGETQFLEGFVEDVTERNRVEAELLKASRALEQSPVTIVITDLTGKIEYVNSAFTQLTGFSREEALGKNPSLLKSGKMPPEDYKQLWDTVLAGHDWRGEFHNKAKDGRLFWESAVISPIKDSKGRITHLLAVKEDITHRKHLEEQLRQAQKMEAIGQLAGGVAHDFNNILAAMTMHLSFMQQNPLLTMDLKESLEEVESETKRAANLTRQLLTFSRRRVARVLPLDLTGLIHDLLKMLRRLLGENIEVNFSSPGPSWVRADAGMMEQVVMNLCINARDAMPKGGTLTLCNTLVELKGESQADSKSRPGSFVCLAISDTGCGMDETVLSRIFEPFFSTKEVGKGTGLGLATVYGIVQQHEGWVEVESKVGQGSIFRVYLPACAQPLQGPAVVRAEEKKRGGSETILLVEDEAEVRRTVGLALRKLGYAVLEAGNGLEAIKVWDEHQRTISLLFSDMVMPGPISGLDLAQRLRNEKPSLKIIISSGYSDDMAEPSLPNQEIHYLPKPFGAAEMARIVRHCLDDIS